MEIKVNELHVIVESKFSLNISLNSESEVIDLRMMAQRIIQDIGSMPSHYKKVESDFANAIMVATDDIYKRAKEKGFI